MVHLAKPPGAETALRQKGAPVSWTRSLVQLNDQNHPKSGFTRPNFLDLPETLRPIFVFRLPTERPCCAGQSPHRQSSQAGDLDRNRCNSSALFCYGSPLRNKLCIVMLVGDFIDLRFFTYFMASWNKNLLYKSLQHYLWPHDDLVREMYVFQKHMHKGFVGPYHNFPLFYCEVHQWLSMSTIWFQSMQDPGT